jgi:hypothetical protein
MPGSSSTALQNDLLKAFPEKLLDAEHPCMPSLFSLLTVYSSSITAEDLYYKVEATLMQDRVQVITQDTVDQIKNSIQRELSAKVKTTASAHKTAFATPAPKPRSALGSL